MVNTEIFEECSAATVMDKTRTCWWLSYTDDWLPFTSTLEATNKEAVVVFTVWRICCLKTLHMVFIYHVQMHSSAFVFTETICWISLLINYCILMLVSSPQQKACIKICTSSQRVIFFNKSNTPLSPSCLLTTMNMKLYLNTLVNEEKSSRMQKWSSASWHW